MPEVRRLRGALVWDLQPPQRCALDVIPSQHRSAGRAFSNPMVSAAKPVTVALLAGLKSTRREIIVPALQQALFLWKIRQPRHRFASIVISDQPMAGSS
jgi:hypothetical protein